MTLLLGLALAAAPLETFNDRLFVDVTVNGIATHALLDSGAELSVASPAFAKAAGLIAGEDAQLKGTGAKSVAVQLVENAAVDALGTHHEAPLAVMDLADISTRLVGRDIDFIVGRPLFDAAALKIDIAAGTIETAGGDRMGITLPLTEAQGIETLPVTLAGYGVPAIFDLGNGNAPIISKGLADRLGVEKVGVTLGGGVGGEKERETVVLPRLVVAGVAYEDLVAVVDATDEGNLLNLGTSIFRDFVIVADFAGRSITLSPQETAK